MKHNDLCRLTVEGRRSCIFILLSEHHFLCKEVNRDTVLFYFCNSAVDFQEPNPGSVNKPTCSVDPGPVAVQLSLNLLLASQLHESPAVLHPLPFLSKLPKPSIQTTKSFDSESPMRIYAHITQDTHWRYDQRKEYWPSSFIQLWEQRRGEKRREVKKVSPLIAGIMKTNLQLAFFKN